MRIETCVERGGRKMTVSVEDDITQASGHLSAQDLVQVLLDASKSDRCLGGVAAEQSEWSAYVTIDGVGYRLPFDGDKIVNTTGRVIAAGSPIYWTKSKTVPCS